MPDFRHALRKTQLWELATYELKPPLNRVDGVSTVLVQGGQVPEFHIIPNPGEAADIAGSRCSDVVNAVQASNIDRFAGPLRGQPPAGAGTGGRRRYTMSAQPANLVVKTTPSGAAGAGCRCGRRDSRRRMPVYTMVTPNGKPAVLINIARQPSSVIRWRWRMRWRRSGSSCRRSLPAGVDLRPFYDQSKLVRSSITSVRDAILIGLVLACDHPVSFLGDWSSSLVAGLVIPVTVAGDVPVSVADRAVFNLMTLGGLAAAIGLVIDDAIVVVENIVLHRDSGQSRVEAVRSALLGDHDAAGGLDAYAGGGVSCR